MPLKDWRRRLALLIAPELAVRPGEMTVTLASSSDCWWKNAGETR